LYLKAIEEKRRTRRVRTAEENMWRGDKQYLTTIYEDDATNANTIEDESLAVLKAVDDLDLRPTTLSANFTDRPACVINFGLGVPSKIKHGFLEP
jgi:hypothetical protein